MNNENKNLSERLRFALKILGVSQTELAKRINVKPQIIQYLCASNAEKSKFTFYIAEALKIDVSWLAIGKGTPPSHSKPGKNERVIPILTFNQIKEWKVHQKEFVPTNVDWLPISNDISIDSFAVVLNDKSMAPRFNLDTTIIIDPTISAYKTQQNNRFVLAYLAAEDFLIFRQLDTDNNIETLVPINNSLYKTTVLNEKDIILGPCKEARWST